VKSFFQYISESKESEYSNLLKELGYDNRQVGEDKHITLTHKTNKDSQFLLDLDGNEWHHMQKGKAVKVGKMDDKGKKEFDDYLLGL
jgi:hypothetical protein